MDKEKYMELMLSKFDTAEAEMNKDFMTAIIIELDLKGFSSLSRMLQTKANAIISLSNKEL